MPKPILCLDFDGVIHSYESGWKGADVIPDRPVDGAMPFIVDALKHFRVAIFSSRSNQPGGLLAMEGYVFNHMASYFSESVATEVIKMIEWPTEKPPALVTIDDRAITFTGTWPTIESLLAFQPWTKNSIRTALHASAPSGLSCADCGMDKEACPTCYAVWWQKRHRNVRQV